MTEKKCSCWLSPAEKADANCPVHRDSGAERERMIGECVEEMRNQGSSWEEMIPQLAHIFGLDGKPAVEPTPETKVIPDQHVGWQFAEAAWDGQNEWFEALSLGWHSPGPFADQAGDTKASVALGVYRAIEAYREERTTATSISTLSVWLRARAGKLRLGDALASDAVARDLLQMLFERDLSDVTTDHEKMCGKGPTVSDLADATRGPDVQYVTVDGADVDAYERLASTPTDQVAFDYLKMPDVRAALIPGEQISYAQGGVLDREVRSVSATGAEKGVKLARHDLVPVRPLQILAEHYGLGSLKYDDRNWEKGYEWSKSYASLQRHLLAFWSGEDIDAETGSPHMAAAAWHCFTLLEFMLTHPKYDDRPRAGAGAARARQSQERTLPDGIYHAIVGLPSQMPWAAMEAWDRKEHPGDWMIVAAPAAVEGYAIDKVEHLSGQIPVELSDAIDAAQARFRNRLVCPSPEPGLRTLPDGVWNVIICRPAQVSREAAHELSLMVNPSDWRIVYHPHMLEGVKANTVHYLPGNGWGMVEMEAAVAAQRRYTESRRRTTEEAGNDTSSED